MSIWEDYMNYKKEVISMLADLLGVEEDIITLDSKLVDDLGAESIDFIDICYQFEKAFHLPKVMLSDIYIDGYSKLQYSDGTIALLNDNYEYLRRDMIQRMKKEQSLDAMKTVRCLVEFINCRMKHAN